MTPRTELSTRIGDSDATTKLPVVENNFVKLFRYTKQVIAVYNIEQNYRDIHKDLTQLVTLHARHA